jgi:hypothetical protein
VQKAYAHPGWIPLARDWGGNNLAVDLAPGPTGKWGQVIIFGRDYDCKYVVARSWSAFLAMVADDLSSEKVFVDEDSGELKLREFKTTTVEPAYLDILRWRMDQKYGRKPPRRRGPPPPGARLSPRTSPRGSPRAGSPHGSPPPSSNRHSEERGRQTSRFSTTAPAASSPLARVQGVDRTTIVGNGKGRSDGVRTSKLIEVPTPTLPDPVLHKRDDKGEDGGKSSATDDMANKMKVNNLGGIDGSVQGLGLNGMVGAGHDGEVDKDGMKAVQL